MIRLSYILILSSFIFSNKIKGQDSITIHTYILETLPKPGDTLKFKDSFKSEGHLLTSSSSFYPYSTFKVKTIEYQIAYDESGIVRYIGTVDSTFITKEGVRIGMTLKEIRSLNQDTNLRGELRIGYYINLPSGWKALFCVGNYCTEREVSEKDRVVCIFNR